MPSFDMFHSVGLVRIYVSEEHMASLSERQKWRAKNIVRSNWQPEHAQSQSLPSTNNSYIKYGTSITIYI
jgi:hypothetical protein